MDRKKRAGWLLLTLALFGFDLWSKALWTYPQPGRIPAVDRWIVPGWLAIEPIYNPGGVWSLPLPSWVLTAVTALAVPLLALWLLFPRRVRGWESAGKALLIAGAAGNLFDRLRFGEVRDFIDVFFGNEKGWHWPTFNVADSALVVGIGLLLVCSFIGREAAGAARSSA